MTVRELNQQKETTGAKVSAIIGLAIAVFVAGILFSASFLSGPPPADLKAEYCRGVGDGENRMYQSMRDYIVGVEKATAADGLTAVLAVLDKDGNVVESVQASVQPFSAQEDLATRTEASCYKLDTQEAIDNLGVRGPSNYMPTTTTAGA